MVDVDALQPKVSGAALQVLVFVLLACSWVCSVNGHPYHPLTALLELEHIIPQHCYHANILCFCFAIVTCWRRCGASGCALEMLKVSDLSMSYLSIPVEAIQRASAPKMQVGKSNLKNVAP